MEYRFLGKTGIKVSQLCFGTMPFGGQADEATSKALFARCRDAGINFFDCANVYNKGRAEEILGALITEHRDEVVITSKVYFPMSEDMNARGASRRHILMAAEASLKRLQTDRIDLYFVHRFDEMTALEETLYALELLVRQGKVVYLGASNFAAWQVEKALGIAERQGWALFDCIQPMYNLVKRQAEVEILPMAQAERLGVIPYSPLGGGLLSGKYGKRKKPRGGRLTENKMYETRYGDLHYFEIAEKFTAFAESHGFHPASLAIAWVGAHPAVTAPIIGARTVEQLEPALASVDIPMTLELREAISRLSPEPPPATDRTEERTEHTYGKR